MRLLRPLVLLLLLLSPAALAEGPKGPLVIAGGEFSSSNPGWQRFAELVKGGPVLIIPTASGDPMGGGARTVKHLQSLGLAAELVPLVAGEGGRDRDGVSEKAEWVEKARAAKGFWFLGGDQGRITGALFRADGSDSGLLAALKAAHAGGAVVGGSSAGAAIMSVTMFKEGPEPLTALRKGLEKGRHTDRGLGFVGTDWFVDQHFLQRGRFARTIVAMRDHGYRRGVGVEEDSAIVVADGRTAEVVGRRGAVLVDMGEATANQGAPVAAKGVKLSFLAPGDRFDLETGAVTPSERKKAGTEIRPGAPGFKPYYGETGAFWYADMLGPQMLYEAMSRVLDSRSGQARGLAFGDPAGENADPLGFEFLLTRGPDTMGWFASDPSNYTVLNVRLELRPVRMTRPLYTPVN